MCVRASVRVRACVRVHARACVRVCAHACAGAGARACVRVCECLRIPSVKSGVKEMTQTNLISEADHVHGVDQVLELLMQHGEVLPEARGSLTHVPVVNRGGEGEEG